MHTTWILAADASRARIFETTDHEKSLQEVEDFVHPKGRVADRDINTDSKGRYFKHAGGPQANTAEPNVDPERHELEIFTKSVSSFLEKARNDHRYDKLCVIAPPKVLGLMRQNLSKEALKLVDEEIPKDISWFETREIEAYLQQYKDKHH